MTDEIKSKILELSEHGNGYQKIATQLNISPNTVKTFLRRQREQKNVKRCLCCGAILQQLPHKKEKKFCSSFCRMRWWNTHQEEVNRKAFYKIKCQCCGKEFETYGNAKQKFCSRKCFAEYRKNRSQSNGKNISRQ